MKYITLLIIVVYLMRTSFLGRHMTREMILTSRVSNDFCNDNAILPIFQQNLYFKDLCAFYL